MAPAAAAFASAPPVTPPAAAVAAAAESAAAVVAFAIWTRDLNDAPILSCDQETGWYQGPSGSVVRLTLLHPKRKCVLRNRAPLTRVSSLLLVWWWWLGNSCAWLRSAWLRRWLSCAAKHLCCFVVRRNAQVHFCLRKIVFLKSSFFFWCEMAAGAFFLRKRCVREYIGIIGNLEVREISWSHGNTWESIGIPAAIEILTWYLGGRASV